MQPSSFRNAELRRAREGQGSSERGLESSSRGANTVGDDRATQNARSNAGHEEFLPTVCGTGGAKDKVQRTKNKNRKSSSQADPPCVAPTSSSVIRSTHSTYSSSSGSNTVRDDSATQGEQGQISKVKVQEREDQRSMKSRCTPVPREPRLPPLTILPFRIPQRVSIITRALRYLPLLVTIR